MLAPARRHPMGAPARVVEAMVLLAMAAIAQRWLPMPKWSRADGKAAAVPAAWRGERIEIAPAALGHAKRAQGGQGGQQCHPRCPVEPKCLAEAAAGQLMLRQLGSPGVVVIGIRPGDDTSTAAWDAHAWLLGRHGALTGGRAARGFTATTVFEVRRWYSRRERFTSKSRRDLDEA